MNIYLFWVFKQFISISDYYLKEAYEALFVVENIRQLRGVQVRCLNDSALPVHIERGVFIRVPHRTERSEICIYVWTSQVQLRWF